MSLSTPITQEAVAISGFAPPSPGFGKYFTQNVDNTVPRVLDRQVAKATVGATPGTSGTLWTYSIPADALTGRAARLTVKFPTFSTFTGDEQIKIKVGGTYLATIDVDTGVPIEIEAYITAAKQFQIVRMNQGQTLATDGATADVMSDILTSTSSIALTTTAAVELKLDYLGATNELNACSVGFILVELL